MAETAKQRFNKHMSELKSSGKTRITLTIGVKEAEIISSMSKENKKIFLNYMFPHALERFLIISRAYSDLEKQGHAGEAMDDFLDWALGLDGATSEYLTADQFLSDNDWHNFKRETRGQTMQT